MGPVKSYGYHLLFSAITPTTIHYVANHFTMTSPSMALAKRKPDNELMPPPPRVKRIKRPVRVLDEDSYSDALSHIIARDFFPGLLELESQEEYLDALSSKDNSWIESAGRKLAAAMTPQHGRRRPTGLTPSKVRAGLRAEQATNSLDGNSQAESKVDLNLSLNDFLAKYTSEDAESFNKVLDKQNQKRAEKHAWLWNGNKLLAPAQIAYRKQQQKLISNAAATKALDGKTPTSITETDTRPAGPESWKHVGKNSLIFQPDNLEDSIQTIQQKSEEISRAAPKKVMHGNTRLASQIFGAPVEDSRPPSPTLSAVKDAIAGRPRIPASEGGYDGSETPRVNGYAFVDSEEPEPEPEPQSKHSLDWSQISFGDIDAKQNPFSMQESSSREKLHHRLVDKSTRKKQEQQKEGQSKTPVTSKLYQSSTDDNSVAAPSLTPAGHRLLGRLGGATPLRNAATADIWNGEKSRTPRGLLLKGLVTPRQ